MFGKRINTYTAKLYRRGIITGINKARHEFNYGHILKNEKPPKQEHISDIVKLINVETLSYLSEKRKHGWVSTPKEDPKTSNGISPALIAAVAAF